MKALILAAGYATRLYPLTKEYPKSLLPVNGRPIIDYIVDRLDETGVVSDIIVVTNSKFFRKFASWRRTHSLRDRICLVDDLTKDNDSRLGAIGDMNFAVDKMGVSDDLLVIGGDNLFSGTLKNFLVFAKTKKVSPVIGVYDIKSKSSASNYGVIKLDADKRIVDFQEKPAKPQSTLVAMCLYFFPKGKLGLIKKYLSSRSKKRDAMGFYIDWLRSNFPVYGYEFRGKWYDIGDYKFYNTAKKIFVG